MFYEPSRFGWTEELVSHWETIRNEFASLSSKQFMPWPETNLYNKGWDVFGLYAFGQRLSEHCTLCPVTTELVESIPGMTTAGFSVLGAQTRIRPHVGYTASVLRFHLGLVVPPICGIRVGDDIRHWKAGGVLVFDDTVEHEAWNKSDERRAVLLLDVKRSPSGVAVQMPESMKSVMSSRGSDTR